MERDYSDTLSNLNFDNIIDAEQLSEIIDKAFELADSMKKLRDTYKASGKLPLSYYHDDYENMQYVVSLIENEAKKFGNPGYTQQSFIEYSKKEIEEMKSNPMLLSINGLDDWMEEGLL